MLLDKETVATRYTQCIIVYLHLYHNPTSKTVTPDCPFSYGRKYKIQISLLAELIAHSEKYSGNIRSHKLILNFLKVIGALASWT